VNSSDHFDGRSISREARQWLAANLPEPRPPISAANSAAARAATKAGFQPAMDAVRQEFAVTERMVDVGGQRCRQVLPARQAASDDAVVMYFFGGGHVVGSTDEDIVLMAPICCEASVGVIAPEYPLAPEQPFPAALDASMAVYRQLVATYGADRVVVSGESAGGNLALATTLAARDEGLALPHALALFSPWADLTFSGDSHLTDRDPTLVMATDDLSPMARLYYGDNDPTSPLISPIFADYHGFPPTMISTGTRDLLLSDCVRIASAMRTAGVDVDLRVREGMWHVFEFYRELPEARAAASDMAGFVRAQLDR